MGLWNYSYVFQMFFVRVPTPTGVKNVGMAMLFVYAFLYALGCAFFNTLVPCITSYLCARFRYKFSKVVYTTVIVTMNTAHSRSPSVGNPHVQGSRAFRSYLGPVDHEG